MKAKKWIALVLAVLMVAAIFTACASGETPSGGNSSGGNGGADDEGEIVEIEFWLAAFGTMSDVEPVDEAVNAITEKEIGVHVNFTRIAPADFETQLTLAITNREQIDVAGLRPNSFMNLYAAGCLRDVTEEVNQYGQEMKALFGDLLNSTTIDGKLYGFPCYRQLNSNYYIIMRTDVLEDLGLTEQASNIKTWADYEVILDAIKNSDWPMSAVGKSGIGGMTHQGALFCGTKPSDMYTFDALGDNVYCIITDNNGNVGSLIESPQYLEQVKMYANWMAAGYIYPDGPYDTETYQSAMGKGAYATTLATCEYGVEVNWKQATSLDLTCPMIAPGAITTASAQKFGTFVPASSKEPAAAVKFLNLMHTNADLMNVLIFGVEGKHYLVNEQGVAHYPEGMGAADVGYHSMDFTMGNQFLCRPWDGSDPDFREKALVDFQNAPVSPYLGLTVDLKEYNTLVAGLSAVTAEYYTVVSSGYYTDELYKEYVDKLHATGMDEYLAIFQDAVNDFLA